MSFDYKGKVIGVTGAASLQGIGFAIAKKFLESGAKVFICDINEAALQEAVVALNAYGPAKGYCLDISKESQVISFFEKVWADYGRIDVFVNNAGIYPQKLICQMDEVLWDLTMNVNLKSVFLCSKETFKYMKETGGVLINAASFAALVASAGSGAYAASKAAVYSLTKTLAAELAPYGIRVNGFIPGVIETNMTKEVIEAKQEKLKNDIALHRFGKPEDVANAIAFLASDEASYITGSFLEISGGKLCVQNPGMPWERV